MAISLSNLVDNLTEKIHKTKCKDCDCFREYESVKDNLIKYKYLSCNKNHSNKIDEELKKRFKNILTFSNNDINTFIFLLRKGIYPYKYMDGLENTNETLPEREEFYSNLNMEDITDADYMHAKKVCKDFKIKKMDEHHDLYLKKDMLSFIIVIFSIVEKVNRVKRQYLNLLYVNICWQLLCWYFIW